MNPWLKDRAVHVLIYGTIILGIGFALYKLFLQPTSKNSTLYTAPSTSSHAIELGAPSYAPLSCASIRVAK